MNDWMNETIEFLGWVGLSLLWVMSAQRPSAAAKLHSLISLSIQSIPFVVFAFFLLNGRKPREKTSSPNEFTLFFNYELNLSLWKWIEEWEWKKKRRFAHNQPKSNWDEFHSHSIHQIWLGCFGRSIPFH